MPVRWKLFRIVCILQMLAASVFAIMALIRFFEAGNFSAFIRIVLYLLIFLQTILAVNIINNNYPDTPVTGKQKTNFNRLFLLNFLFLVFLFGIVFSEYRQLNALAQLTGKSILELPFEWFIYLIIHLIVLIFQFIILYGLYQLRRELYFNFMKKEFDFEKNQSLR
jgi:hypothetical protein